MSRLMHFVTWQVTSKELRELADHLEETPIISFQIAKNVELTLKLKKQK